MSEINDEVTHLKLEIEREEFSLKQLGNELRDAENEIKIINEQEKENLQAHIVQLDKNMSTYKEQKTSSHHLEKLNTAKIELAVKLREVLSLKRRLDEVPCQSELIQYEQRFSELDVQIQEKFRQTRKCYATYNALLEIKELALKETSLLNSITSQFHEAITNPAGRIKLIDSMEGIVKGTQQKLEKVQLGLQNEQTLCDALKEKYNRSIVEQRRYSSLLKALQEERAKYERLRRQTST